MTLTEPQLRRLVRACLVLVAVGFTASIALELAAGRVDEAVFSLLLLSFPAVGFSVLRRRPDARLAWLMAGLGVVAAIRSFAGLWLLRDGVRPAVRAARPRDRLGALDGQVTVASAPGHGTVVSGRLPVGASSGTTA